MSQNIISAEIFDILLYEESFRTSSFTDREFSALSMRLASGKSVFRYDGKNITAKGGDIAYVPKNLKYKRISDSEKLIAFHFHEHRPTGKDISLFTPKDTAKYQKMFEEALSLWLKKDIGYRYKVTAIFYEILASLTSEGMIFSQEYHKDIALALDIIEKRFSDASFRTSEIAAEMYVSETFLRRKFKAKLGVSPKQYIISRRIKEAKIMLDSGYFTQVEISEKCGFSDVKYFRTAFKESEGITVSQYKSKA